MSELGLPENGSGASAGKPWHAPQITVLVFRATAGAVGFAGDTEIGGPPPPPLPPPPPIVKGAKLCDGNIPAVPISAGTNDPQAAKILGQTPDTHLGGCIAFS